LLDCLENSEMIERVSLATDEKSPGFVFVRDFVFRFKARAQPQRYSGNSQRKGKRFHRPIPTRAMVQTQAVCRRRRERSQIGEKRHEMDHRSAGRPGPQQPRLQVESSTYYRVAVRTCCGPRRPALRSLAIMS